MTPVGRLILLRSFPRNQLVTAMTYMTLPAIVGPVIGPLLGGFLTTYASWRWIFYVNLPFGCLGLLAAIRYVEDVRGETQVKFDFPGFLLVGLGLGLLQYGIENLSRPTIPWVAIVAVIVAAVLCLLGFARYARKAPMPVVDPTLFRQRTFRIGTLFGGLCRIGVNGVPFLLPLMLQVGLGMSPIASGSVTFAASFGGFLVRPVLSRVLKAIGFRNLLFWSAVLCAAGIAGFALVRSTTPHWQLIGFVIAFGLLRSVQFMASNTLSYADTPASQLSRATSLGGVLQQLSVSFGVSVSAMLLGLVSRQDHILTPARFHEVFLLMAVFPLLSLVGFWRLRPEDGAQVSGYRSF